MLFKCTICSYMSINNSHVKRHMISKHHDNNLYNNCEQNVDQISGDLNQNSENPNQNEQNCNLLSENVDQKTTSLQCDKCSKTLSNKRNLIFNIS